MREGSGRSDGIDSAGNFGFILTEMGDDVGGDVKQ